VSLFYSFFSSPLPCGSQYWALISLSLASLFPYSLVFSYWDCC
jgi:hypothetical protein